MTSSSDSTAMILKLPLEITIMIVTEVFRDEIVELQDLKSLSNLTEIAKTDNILSVLRVGLLSGELGEKILL